MYYKAVSGTQFPSVPRMPTQKRIAGSRSLQSHAVLGRGELQRVNGILDHEKRNFLQIYTIFQYYSLDTNSGLSHNCSRWEIGYEHPRTHTEIQD